MGGAQSARQDRNSPEEPALAAREPFDSATQAPVAPISQIETISTEDKKEDTSEEEAESFSDWISSRSPATSQRSSLGSGSTCARPSSMSSPPSGSNDAPSSTCWIGERPSADTPLHPSDGDRQKFPESGNAPPGRASMQLSDRTSGSIGRAGLSPGASARSSFALERAGIEANRLSMEAFMNAFNSSGAAPAAEHPPHPPSGMPDQACDDLGNSPGGTVDMLMKMVALPSTMRDQFAALCALPPQTPAPASTLAKLWGIDEREIPPMLSIMASKSVISVAQLPTGQLWALPQAQRLELLHLACGNVAAKYHARLVDAYTAHAGPYLERQEERDENGSEAEAKALADAPDDGYSLANMGHHVMGANRASTMKSLLLDPGWLDRKLKASGPAAVVADFRRYLLFAPERDVKLVLEAFQMSVGLAVAHANVPGLLRCVMAGRLMTAPLSSNMQSWVSQQKALLRVDAVAAVKAGRLRCLAPLTPSLDQTGGLQRLALKGHGGSVSKVILTPSGTDAISASSDGTVRVWDLEIGDCILVLDGHARAISDMALTADGSLLVTSSEDGTSRAYEMEHGQCLRVLAGHEGAITALALDPYGRFAVTGSVDCTVRVWDMASARALHVISLRASVTVLSLSPCTRYVLQGCSDGAVRLNDVSSGLLMGSMLGHSARITSVAFTKDSKRAISSSQDGTLRVWSLRSGQCLNLADCNGGSVNTVSIEDSGRLAAVGCEDGTAQIWDLKNGTCRKVLQGHREWVFHVALSPSGTRLLTSSADGTAIAWSVDSGELIRVLEGHSGAVLCGALTQRGRFAVTGSEDGSVRVWDFTASSSHTPKWHEGRIRALAACDGMVVATAGEDCVARLWDAALGEYKGLLEGHRVPIRWAMFSSDGAALVTASPDRTVCVWDCQSMELLHKLPVHKGSRMKSFSASGDLSTCVVCLFDSTVTVWDLIRGEPTVPLQKWGQRDESMGHTSAVNEVLMGSDGDMVVTLSKDSTARVWNAETGVCRHVLRGHSDAVCGGRLSDGGRVLATYSFDGTVKQWSIDDGSCLATLPLPSGVSRMALSRCGWIVGAALEDGSIVLCNFRDLSRGAGVVTGHSAEVTDICFSVDGQLLVTCSLDCTARLIDVTTGDSQGIFVSDCGLTCCHYDSVTQSIVAGTDRGVVHFVDAAFPE